jgi:NAD(P)-dependent dehydrogenase (short-subunit alcohol dehydrogenase family)
VTGGGSGIGRATVERLSAEGAAVLAVDVAAASLDETVARCDKSDGGPVAALVGDVSDPEFAPAAVAEAVRQFGGLDVLANVAGILRTAHTHEHSLEMWEKVMAVNLTGTFLFSKAAIPVLLERSGNIVNTSSTAALAGLPWGAAYAASKGGVLALTRVIAIEYGRQGLRCNAVCPGSIETPILNDFAFPEGADMKLTQRAMALDRPRGPETVASTIAFLASDDAAHVNGEHVRVDGATLS